MTISPFFLTTDRLGFRHWAPGDLHLAASLWGSAEVTRLFVKEPLDEKEVKKKLDLELQNQKRHGFQYWPFFLLKSHSFAGCCGLRPFDPGKGICEIGYHLLPEYWGRGFASEAAQAIVDYTFTTLSVGGLSAGHHPDNTASRRILLKLGFKGTGAVFYEPTGLMHPGYLLMKKDLPIEPC